MAFLESSLFNGTVYIQKRSPQERDAINAALGSASLTARPVESVSEMLNQIDRNRPACLIMDLPTANGHCARTFEGLSLDELETPVEMGSAQADSHTLVICAACLTESGCTFREGNFSFLKRPYSRRQLLDALQNALASDRAYQEQSQRQAQVREKIATLTDREHQVMDLIYEGLPNKTIAGHLSLSTRTVEAARAAVYRKLGVDSGIALVRLLARAEYEVTKRESD